MDAIGRYEGTVAPSHLTDMHGSARVEDFVRNLPVRAGRVVRVHAPDADTSHSKRFHEYDVLVDSGSEHQVPTRYTVPHCVVNSAFGGRADFSRWTPRQVGGSDRNAQQGAAYGPESVVFIVLVDGSTFGGVILGGAQSVNEIDAQDDGHHAAMQFNGVRIDIDKDGSLHLVRRGATDADDRKTSSSDPEGSKIQLLTGGDAVVDSRHDVRVIADNEINAQSQKKVSLASTLADMQLAAATTIQTTSAFVKLGAATDQMVKGTTYRAAESAANLALAAGLSALAAAMGILAVNPTVSPDTGPTPGPVSSTFITAAGALTTAAAALSTMEASAALFLSAKNSLD